MSCIENEAHLASLERVTRRARATLAEYGMIEPFCELECSDGLLNFGLEFETDQEKTTAVNLIRALTVVERAKRVVLVSETWKASDGWRGRAHKDPNRREGVIVMVEDALGHSLTELDLQRGLSGVALGAPKTTYKEGPNCGSGRFDRLLVPVDLHDREPVREAAEAFLQGRIRVNFLRSGSDQAASIAGEA